MEIRKVRSTPGPWTWRGHICTGIEGPDAQVVADVGLACGAIEKSEAQANARLIAAAPDLLEALKAFLRAPSIGSSGPGSVTIEVQTFNLEAARAAIAKAEPMDDRS